MQIYTSDQSAIFEITLLFHVHVLSNITRRLWIRFGQPLHVLDVQNWIAYDCLAVKTGRESTLRNKGV